MLHGVLHVVDGDLDLKADAIVRELFDLSPHAGHCASPRFPDRGSLSPLPPGRARLRRRSGCWPPSSRRAVWPTLSRRPTCAQQRVRKPRAPPSCPTTAAARPRTRHRRTCRASDDERDAASRPRSWGSYAAQLASAPPADATPLGTRRSILSTRGCGGTGRRAGFRTRWAEPLEVRVLSPALPIEVRPAARAMTTSIGSVLRPGVSEPQPRMSAAAAVKPRSSCHPNEGCPRRLRFGDNRSAWTSHSHLLRHSRSRSARSSCSSRRRRSHGGSQPPRRRKLRRRHGSPSRSTSSAPSS